MDVKLHIRGKNNKEYEFKASFTEEEFEMLAQVGLHKMIEDGIYEPEIPEDLKKIIEEEQKVHVLEAIPRSQFFEV